MIVHTSCSFPRTSTFILLLVALSATSGTAQPAAVGNSPGDQERVALLPVDNHGFSSAEIALLSQGFADGLAESRRFHVMTDTILRSGLDQVRRAGLESCKTIVCLANIGKVLNAEKVVYIRAERWDQRYMLHIRMVRSSDAALLYDERVDFSGDIRAFSTSTSVEQGRKLASAFLDRKPNWILLCAVLIAGVGVICWLFAGFLSGNKSGSRRATT